MDQKDIEYFRKLLTSMLEEAARLLIYHQQGSTSLIQRKFSIGYNRAGRLMDQLEAARVSGFSRDASRLSTALMTWCLMAAMSASDSLPYRA